MSFSKEVLRETKKVDSRASKESGYNLVYDQYINYFFILLISAFIIIIPFFRGLYFRENYIPSIIYISGVFVLYILYKLTKKDYKIFNSYLDIAMLLLPVVYLISFFFSVNAKDAFDAVIKYAGYFMIYKIASDLSRDPIYKKALEYAVITAIFVMAAAGLLVAFGYLDLKGTVIEKRIFGLYQYPNATASAMGAAIFMILGFSLNSSKMYEKVFCNLVLTTAFPVFILTLSRGAYIIFAMLAILNIIMLDARKRVEFFYSILALLASSSVFLFKYYSEGKASTSVLYFIASIIVFLVLQLLYNKLISKPIARTSTKAINMVLLLSIAASVAVAAILFSFKVPIEYQIEHAIGEAKSWKSKGFEVYGVMPNKEYIIQFYAKSNLDNMYGYGVVVDSINEVGDRTKILEQFNPAAEEFKLVKHKFKTNTDTKSVQFAIYNYEENSYTIYKDIQILDLEGNIIKRFDRYKYLPEAISTRLMDISLKVKSASARVYYLKDGIKIFKDYFLTGTGGGGWKNLYRQYQSLPYDSNEAHNYYLQYAIETGILGMAVLLAVYGLFLRKACISLFKDKKYSQLPIYLALLMMMGHAFMDFDLSLTALAFLFWMMIGIATAKEKTGSEKLFNNNYLVIGVLVGTVVVLYISSSIYIGMLQGKEAASLINTDINKSVSLYESAMRKDPNNINYHMDYMQVMYKRYKSNHDSVSLGKMEKSMDKVLEMKIQDTKQGSIMVNLLLGTGKLDLGMKVVNEMVDNNPMVADMYMYKLNVNYEIAKQLFSMKEHKKAIPYLNNMIEAEQQFNITNARAAVPMKEPEKMNSMVKLAKNWLKQAERRQ